MIPDIFDALKGIFENVFDGLNGDVKPVKELDKKDEKFLKPIIKHLDLTNQEDLNEYLETCEELRNNKLYRSMYKIFDFNGDDDFDKFIDDLKNLGYRVYTEAQAEQTKQEIEKQVEEEHSTCQCNCEHDDDKINPTIGDYVIAVNDDVVYVGILKEDNQTTFTIDKPKKIVCKDAVDTGFNEMTLLKTVWNLCPANNYEISLYEKNNEDIQDPAKQYPSFGLTQVMLDDINEMIDDYMDKYSCLYSDNEIDEMHNYLFEYTAFLLKKNLINI